MFPEQRFLEKFISRKDNLKDLFYPSKGHERFLDGNFMDKCSSSGSSDLVSRYVSSPEVMFMHVEYVCTDLSWAGDMSRLVEV